MTHQLISILSTTASANRWRFVVLCLIAIIINPKIEAKPLPMLARSLTMTFSTDQTSSSAELESYWQSFCQLFSKQFEIGKGPQGRGIFQESSCQKHSAPSQTHELSAAPGAWRFTLKHVAGKTSFSIYYSSKPTPISSLDLPDVINPGLLFSNMFALQYLVAQVYRKLPAAWIVTLPRETTEWTLPGFEKDRMPGERPVSKMLLFHLSYDPKPGLWIPGPVALAKRDDFVDDQSDSAPFQLIKIGPNLRAGKNQLWAQEVYSLDDNDRALDLMNILNTKTTLEAAGPLREIEKALVVSSFRYLSPFPRTDAGISQAPKLELAVKLQKGWFKGLSLALEKSQPPPEGFASPYPFHWLRESAAWAIGLGFDRTTDAVTFELRIAPSVGLLSLDANIENSENALSTKDALNFHTRNQLEFGGQILGQLTRGSFNYVFYGMYNLSGYVMQKPGDAKVSDLRVGTVIHYLTPFKPFGVNFGLEALAYTDWLSFKQNAQAAPDAPLQLAADQSSPLGVSLTVFYAGIGCSLAW